MPIRNFGAGTVKFNEGIVVTGSSPTPHLYVSGNIGIDEYIYHNGDANTYIGFSSVNNVNLVANGHSFLKYDGTIKINTANRDRDTQIMADDGNVILHIDAGTNRAGIGTTGPQTALDVHYDYHVATFETQLAAGQGGGKILKYSPGAGDTLAVGQLYFLHTDGTWNQTDADAVATGGSQLLGVGLGAARTIGVLIEGFVRVPAIEILNTPGSGAVDGLPVYVSTTAGHFDFTAPSSVGDFVRVVGYAIDDDSNDVLVYFNPSSTWIEL